MIDLATLRAKLDSLASLGNAEMWQLLELAEISQRYEAALREIVEKHDEQARLANFKRCGCNNCEPARKALEEKGDGRA